MAEIDEAYGWLDGLKQVQAFAQTRNVEIVFNLEECSFLDALLSPVSTKFTAGREKRLAFSVYDKISNAIKLDEAKYSHEQLKQIVKD